MTDDLRRTYDLGKESSCVSFSMRIPRETGDRLAKHCLTEGRVKAWVVVRAIEEWLERNDKKGERR